MSGTKAYIRDSAVFICYCPKDKFKRKYGRTIELDAESPKKYFRFALPLALRLDAFPTREHCRWKKRLLSTSFAAFGQK